eukprot:5428294-Prymnesium_polylepis.1
MNHTAAAKTSLDARTSKWQAVKGAVDAAPLKRRRSSACDCWAHLRCSNTTSTSTLRRRSTLCGGADCADFGAEVLDLASSRRAAIGGFVMTAAGRQRTVIDDFLGECDEFSTRISDEFGIILVMNLHRQWQRHCYEFYWFSRTFIRPRTILTAAGKTMTDEATRSS